jgi:hypothetical protein
MIIAISALAIPAARLSSGSGTSMGDSSYVLVGGQNGTWFDAGQTPRLERVDLGNYSVTPLTPAPSTSSQPGTVWGGAWNGSQWLISGFGEDDGSSGSNPYIYLYDGQNQILAGTLNQSQSELSWQGGDIFAASYNGKEWLLSGLGSGLLSSYNSVNATNHMSLATFDGYKFTDLSNVVPDQQDGILYANAWNGRYWLVGGGYKDIGVLFSFDGRKITDLTNNITEAVPEFGSVQALAWNGHYWLIGGYHFLAAYDGHKFTDLTDKLGSVLSSSSSCCTAVNAIAWNGAEWMLGGGTPISQTNSSQAWLVTYSSKSLVNLTPEIHRTVAELTSDSSILTIAAAPNSWVIGGYLKNQGLLYEYSGVSFTNLSYLVSNYTYVNWVGVGATQNHIQPISTHPTTRNHAIIPESRMMNQHKAWIAGNLHSFEMDRFD